MAIHVGTSGWSYPHWEGVLYPPGLDPRGRFPVYARAFGTVELNSSYYRWPRPASFARWRRESRSPATDYIVRRALRSVTRP